MPSQGRCACGSVYYELHETPLYVHCCHCTWCQRESGSAFAINAMIEARHVHIRRGEVETVDTPSESGSGQVFFRCPTCKVALWSVYSGAGEKFRFVRVGTLDAAATVSPDIHIYTSTKLPWVNLPADVPASEGFYRRSQMWPEESLKRREAELARLD